jgi:heptosyltransferase III
MKICIESDATDLGVMVVRNLLIKLLRHKYPKAHIVLLTEAEIINKVRAFHESNSWVDEFVAIDSKPGQSLAHNVKLWWQIWTRHFDMIVIGPHSTFPVQVAYWSGIPIRVGLCFGAKQRRYLTHPVRLQLSNGEKYVHLHWSRIVAAYAESLQLSDFTQVSDYVPFIRLNSKHRSRDRNNFNIVVHAGGNVEWNRRWPLNNYSRLCRLLSQRSEVVIFLVGGKDENVENGIIMKDVTVDNRSAQIHDVSGCTVDAMVDCIARADLFVGNDSGPMNIAVAVGTPVIVIRGADSENFRPDVIDSKHLVLSNWLNCSRYRSGSNTCTEGCPVAYDRARQDYPKCLAAISVDSVWNAVETRLPVGFSKA